MRTSREQPNIEPRSGLPSSLAKVEGHGSSHEKRASMVETFAKLKRIIGILPHDSKLKLARQAELISKDPEAAVEAIRAELELQRTLLDLLEGPLSTDEALRMLEELLPKGPIQ